MQTTIADANHRGFWGYLGLEAFTITWACWLALVPSWRCLPPYSSAAYVSPLQQGLCVQHCPALSSATHVRITPCNDAGPAIYAAWSPPGTDRCTMLPWHRLHTYAAAASTPAVQPSSAASAESSCKYHVQRTCTMFSTYRSAPSLKLQSSVRRKHAGSSSLGRRQR